MTKTVSAVCDLPATGYVRQSQLIGTPARKADAEHAQDAKPGILPFSSPTLWRMVKAGKFPAPVKLSERVTAWRVEDIRAWMQTRTA
jgi:prophage regulatory protein